jgi:glucokinase
MKVLAGDLGGTKALLGIADLAEGRPKFLLTRRLASADFSGVAGLLEQFRAEAGDALRGVAAACLAVAGPLSADGRRVRFTNLPWESDADELSRQLGMPVRFANDFAAVAAGVSAVAPEQLITLQAGAPVANGLRLAIGAGTGLGVAAVVGEGRNLRILSSEGGHVGFAPANELQDAFAVWLRREHERATAERAISGMGLINLYRFLATRETPEDPDPLVAADPAAVIGARALSDAGSLARKAAMEFFACYGAFAGDMALAFMARGGVYLAGGVTQKLQPLLLQSAFLTAFNAKAEHADLAEQMPVLLVTDPEIGLAGAAVLARPPDS